MFQVFRKELNWGGRRLVLETGKIARQADGAVLATYGETTVLCTAVAAKSAKPGQDFFPLTVNYQEKTFAAGKIPGGFFKREGRLSEEVMLGAVTFGHKNFQPVIQAIIELAETCAKDPWNLAEPPANKATIEGRLRDAIGPQVEAAYRERNKQERSNRLDAAKLTAAALFEDEGERALALKLFKDIEKEIVRGAILRGEQRIDGRDT